MDYMPQEVMIEMGEAYPFGELPSQNAQNVLVRKTLHLASPEERAVIAQMVHFLKAARHDYLVNLERVLDEEEKVHLCYEYAPLRLERWLLAVNADLLSELQAQLLQLAEFLTRASIAFTFRPEAIGLSSDMTIKYFLSEFAVDAHSYEDHFPAIRSKIRSHFQQLQEGEEGEREEKGEGEREEKGEGEREEGEREEEKDRLGSMSTNGSMSPGEEIGLPVKSKTRLSKQVEDSKRKSMEVLLRFQKMRQK